MTDQNTHTHARAHTHTQYTREIYEDTGVLLMSSSCGPVVAAVEL